ncbi:UbiA family prenyltransferase [Holospora curviuscula]|uniref:4-hydroxybenzoate octaprenyltransferase n=1 Tax=Holospora curviuscula TaxID=1082868 RepID=A0A2S5R8X2_9PROT|nr:UbiA family prenyltransferase [Holospora curviuscula]PPE03733.1 4-hydroxybenzoate octaprenyltransferase [Holospora curviuscula]
MNDSTQIFFYGRDSLRNSPWEGWKLWFRAARLIQVQGILLLFWPCFWGYLYNTTENVKIWILVWLLGGAAWMRSVGCVYNDWVDAPLDKFVPRTQHRPLIFRAQGWKIPMICVCGLFGFLALFTLPFNVILWGGSGWILSLAYPWIKRYIVPQGALGLLFGWGVWIGSAFSIIPRCFGCWGLYSVAILWTIEYDTVYSAPDQWADRELGLKSVSRYAGHHTRRVILGVCILRWLLMGILSTHSTKAFVLTLISANTTYYSLQQVRFSQPHSCHQYFLLQAWIQGGLLTLWAYFLSPFR